MEEQSKQSDESAKADKTYATRKIPLKNITERKALKEGIAKAYDLLVVKREADVTTLAESCRWQKKGFYSRLFSGQIEFKALPASDVIGAEWDLRNLNVQQLLWIRKQTLEMDTEGKSNFTAHNSFLNKVESYLFELLGRILLSGKTQEYGLDAAEAADKLALHSFGTTIATVLGATAMEKLDSEHDVPPVWVFILDEVHWLGRAAVLHIEELWAEDIPCQMEDLCELMPSTEQFVAAVCDRHGVQRMSPGRKSVVAKAATCDKAMQWEICVLNVLEDDAFTEMAKQAEKDHKTRKSMYNHSAEMKSRLTKRQTQIKHEALAAGALDSDDDDDEEASPDKRESIVSSKSTKEKDASKFVVALGRRSLRARQSHAALLATSFIELCGEPTPEDDIPDDEEPPQAVISKKAKPTRASIEEQRFDIELPPHLQNQEDAGSCADRCTSTCAIS